MSLRDSSCSKAVAYNISSNELLQKLIFSGIYKKDYGLSSSGKAVLQYLCASYNMKQGKMWPKQKTIAEYMGITERSVQNGIDEIQEKGLLLTNKVDGRLRYYFTKNFWEQIKVAPVENKEEEPKNFSDENDSCSHENNSPPHENFSCLYKNKSNNKFNNKSDDKNFKNDEKTEIEIERFNLMKPSSKNNGFSFSNNENGAIDLKDKGFNKNTVELLKSYEEYLTSTDIEKFKALKPYDRQSFLEMKKTNYLAEKRRDEENARRREPKFTGSIWDAVQQKTPEEAYQEYLELVGVAKNLSYGKMLKARAGQLLLDLKT